jgi:hypothetical protein
MERRPGSLRGHRAGRNRRHPRVRAASASRARRAPPRAVRDATGGARGISTRDSVATATPTRTRAGLCATYKPSAGVGVGGSTWAASTAQAASTTQAAAAVRVEVCHFRDVIEHQDRPRVGLEPARPGHPIWRQDPFPSRLARPRRLSAARPCLGPRQRRQECSSTHVGGRLRSLATPLLLYCIACYLAQRDLDRTRISACAASLIRCSIDRSSFPLRRCRCPA